MTPWRPCPIRHCWPVGEATEILGVRAVIASELKQTRASAWVRGSCGRPVTSRCPPHDRPVTGTDGPHRRPVGWVHVRILVTNDDGVGAPGLAALTRALVAWAADAGSDGPGAAHEII